MQIAALRRLLTLHLAVASRLRLLELPDDGVIKEFVDEPGDWENSTFEGINRFERSIEAAEARFRFDWRLRSCHLGDELTLSRVVRLADLGYVVRAALPRTRESIRQVRDDLAMLSPELSRPYIPDNSEATGVIKEVACMMADLRSAVVGSQRSPLRVPASAVHGRGSCWMTRASLPLTPCTAQHYRDRLGLHHYPRDGTVADQLVLLTFRAKLSKSPCPEVFDPTLIDRVPDGLWLVRPTIYDRPNARFAQGHSGDSPTTPAQEGATIDIGSDSYAEGEAELILLAGRDAEVEWIDVQMLEGGPATRRPRDDDHASFLALLDQRLTGLT